MKDFLEQDTKFKAVRHDRKKSHFDVILVEAPGYSRPSFDRDKGDRPYRSDLHRSLLFSPLS